jgi:APA family basic amino acid/polyamine antiporter
VKDGASPDGFARRLSAIDLTLIVVGSCIGSGVFLTPGAIAGELHAPLAILGIWVLGGAMTLSGALTYAELGALFPRAGGVYVYLTEAYGDLVGFLYGWANFLVITSGSIAALAVAFATYVGYFVPLGSFAVKLLAVFALAIATLVNLAGVKAGAVVANVCTAMKLLGIALVVYVGLALGSSHTSDFGHFALPAGTSAGSAIAAALVGVLWSYGGWQHVTFASAETKHPTRDVPRALLSGAALVTLVYALTNVAYLFLLTPEQMAGAKDLAADAIGTRLGHAGGAAIAATIVISTLGTTVIYTMTAPRMYYAMATRGVFFEGAARLSARSRTPALAVVLQSIWSGVLVMFWGTFEKLISYVVITEWVFFALAGASVFVFRRKLAHEERPYRVPLYPLPSLFFVGVSAWFVINGVIGKPEEGLAGIGFLAVGVPVFFFWRWKRRGSKADPPAHAGV